MSTNITVFRTVQKMVDGQLRAVTEQLDPYIYTLPTPAALGAGGTATANVTVQRDADFYCTKLVYMADIAGGVQTDGTRVIPLVRAQITDTGSGRNMSDIAVDLSSLAGTGKDPFEFDYPRLFSALSSIQCTYTNYSAATTYANVRLSLIGYKAWNIQIHDTPPPGLGG